MNFTHSSWIKRAAAMFVLATASLLVMTATSFAQGHSQGHERRDLKDHQRAERNQFKYEQRAERNGYYNNGGYYGNGHSNSGYYNNGHNNGYYNNGGYYTRRGHYDSGSFGNRLRHAFGGR